MSFFSRAKDVTSNLAVATRRQAKRRKLELQIRRLTSRASSEKASIGEAVFPLLQSGTLILDLPEVAAHMNTVSELMDEIARKQAEIASLGRTDAADHAARQVTSMRKVDANATAQASAEQTAEDVAAEKQGSPADQGGEG